MLLFFFLFVVWLLLRYLCSSAHFLFKFVFFSVLEYVSGFWSLSNEFRSLFFGSYNFFSFLLKLHSLKKVLFVLDNDDDDDNSNSFLSLVLSKRLCCDSMHFHREIVIFVDLARHALKEVTVYIYFFHTDVSVFD